MGKTLIPVGLLATAMLLGCVPGLEQRRIPGLEQRRIPGFTFQGTNAQGYDEYTHGSSGIRFVHLPGGEFWMGSLRSEEGHQPNEGPEHIVSLSPFLIAKYEVTQKEYRVVMAGNTAVPYLSANPSRDRGDDLPVAHVSWDDLHATDGFLERTGLVLPSEAQWEYACRAGTSGPYAGNGVLDDMGWYDRNSGGSSHPVGRKMANQFGLHDMHGNVFEWCEDLYNWRFYSSAGAAGPDPLSTGGSGFRVLRGGHFNFDAQDARSAIRSYSVPSFRGLGFRPARPLP
jgi:formylglycine-generating enzyme required for sulfatase activity